MDKHLWQYQGIKKILFSLSVITVIQAICIIVQAVFLSKAITHLFQGETVQTVLPSFAFFLLAFVLRHGCQWLKERNAAHYAERTAKSMQFGAMEKLFTLGPRYVGKHGTGSFVTLMQEGIPKFRKYLELFLPRILSMVIVPMLILPYVFYLDVLSGITLLVTLPILIVFLVLIGLVTQKKIDAQMATYQLLSRHFVDSLRGLVTLKYLGKSKEHEQSIATVSNKYRMATNRSLRFAFLSSFSLDFFASLSVALVAVQLGIRLIEGHITLFPALLVLVLAPEYFLAIREFGNDYHATLDGKEIGGQLRDILQENDESDMNEASLPITWQEDSELALFDVEKHAEDGTGILGPLSFKMKGYQKIGIVGSSGAGKSTLVDLLAGFTSPNNGHFQVNDRKTDTLHHSNWFEQLSYIPQHPTIFSDTLANNIRFYQPNASIEQVKEAASKAGLDLLIGELPNGLEELVGQGGRQLSGGEEQRIAVARSFLQNRSVLLLDEPTAHLDIETEHELKNTLLPLFDRKLVILATHRLHWMKEMDVVIVLEEGKLAEIGPHEELLEKNGVYARLLKVHRGGTIK